jgi:hypothetical protein
MSQHQQFFASFFQKRSKKDSSFLKKRSKKLLPVGPVSLGDCRL